MIELLEEYKADLLVKNKQGNLRIIISDKKA